MEIKLRRFAAGRPAVGRWEREKTPGERPGERPGEESDQGTVRGAYETRRNNYCRAITRRRQAHYEAPVVAIAPSFYAPAAALHNLASIASVIPRLIKPLFLPDPLSRCTRFPFPLFSPVSLFPLPPSATPRLHPSRQSIFYNRNEAKKGRQ